MIEMLDVAISLLVILLSLVTFQFFSLRRKYFNDCKNLTLTAEKNLQSCEEDIISQWNQSEFIVLVLNPTSNEIVEANEAAIRKLGIEVTSGKLEDFIVTRNLHDKINIEEFQKNRTPFYVRNANKQILFKGSMSHFYLEKKQKVLCIIGESAEDLQLNKNTLNNMVSTLHRHLTVIEIKGSVSPVSVHLSSVHYSSNEQQVIQEATQATRLELRNIEEMLGQTSLESGPVNVNILITDVIKSYHAALSRCGVEAWLVCEEEHNVEILSDARYLSLIICNFMQFMLSFCPVDTVFFIKKLSKEQHQESESDTSDSKDEVKKSPRDDKECILQIEMLTCGVSSETLRDHLNRLDKLSVIWNGSFGIGEREGAGGSLYIKFPCTLVLKKQPTNTIDLLEEYSSRYLRSAGPIPANLRASLNSLAALSQNFAQLRDMHTEESSTPVPSSTWINEKNKLKGVKVLLIMENQHAAQVFKDTLALLDIECDTAMNFMLGMLRLSVSSYTVVVLDKRCSDVHVRFQRDWHRNRSKCILFGDTASRWAGVGFLHLVNNTSLQPNQGLYKSLIEALDTTCQAVTPPLKVLVCDDSQMKVRLLVKMIERAEHTAVGVNSAESALESLQNGQFDALFIGDIWNGVETIQQLRKLGFAKLPIVGFSTSNVYGHSHEIDKELYSLLRIPVRFQQIKSVLEDIHKDKMTADEVERRSTLLSLKDICFRKIFNTVHLKHNFDRLPEELIVELLQFIGNPNCNISNGFSSCHLPGGYFVSKVVEQQQHFEVDSSTCPLYVFSAFHIVSSL